MAESGYAVVSLDDAPWSTGTGGPSRADLTDALGAVESSVDATRFDADDAVELGPDREQLLVVLEGAAPLALAGGSRLDPLSLGCVTAGVGATVRADGPATVLTVSVEGDRTPDGAPGAVDLDAVEFTVPSTSDVATAFLTAPLGCRGLKVNARRLEPGQVVPYHTEGEQEELFVPVRGPASLRVDGTVHPMSTGSVARVAPDVPRSAVNGGDEDALWVMVGAPPTGGPTDWDPGAEILE